ncbi:hypothetical protein V5799_033144 [Amblyomma americanum]|uniref:Ubiquitin-conjugating enzyme E2 Z n=1 Tax=Amblyomma americanum TaxID=6943 RepID=A0AAQ4DP56_AMBAM
MKDVADFKANRPPLLHISPVERDITKIHALIEGTPGTPYEGGFFLFLIRCPPTYPADPPRVRFLTTDAERVRFHMHLQQTGMVCLSILGTAGRSTWSPVESLSSLLSGIRSLMGQRPYFDAFQQEFKPGDADRYHALIQHETIRVAVCDQVEAALKKDGRLPPAFRGIVLRSFLKYYGKYEEAINVNLYMCGKVLTDPILFSHETQLQYKALRKRLEDLKQQVLEK